LPKNVNLFLYEFLATEQGVIREKSLSLVLNGPSCFCGKSS